MKPIFPKHFSAHLPEQKGWVYHSWAIGIVLAVGTLLSGAAALMVSQWETSNNQIRFERQTENLTTGLQRSLNRYTDILRSMQDFYRASPEAIDRITFAALVQRSLVDYPGIQALEWAPRVDRAERSAFEQQIQAEGYERFQITELVASTTLIRARDRAMYFPVTYVEPLTENEAALGFDLASNPVRQSAMDIARDAGQIIATGRIRLVQERKDQFGFLVFLPVYRSPMPPDSIQERRQQLKGFLLGVFRIADVVEESLQDLNYNINFQLYDQSSVDAGARFLGFYDAARKTVIHTAPVSASRQVSSHFSLCVQASSCTRSLLVGGRSWLVKFQPAPTYINSPPYGTLATLIIGLLLTGLVALTLSNYQAELSRTRELSDLKLRFFSMASHELRTPLSSILLTAQSLQSNADLLSTAQQQKSLQRIQTAAQRMTQLITDILTLTRAEVGKLEVTLELLNLTRFCEQLIEEIQPTIAQNIYLNSNSQEIRIALDKKLMRSLFTNLISNASKYSAANSKIIVTLTEQATQVVMQVCDRGIGIPAADFPQLYQAFCRGSNVGDVVGTGLGLAVVRTCVELHQGTIDIDSKENQGTIVTVRLPIR